MEEKEKAKLLRELRRAAKQLALAKDVRRQATLEAVQADIPRQEIAEALGVHRNTVYQIISND